MSKQEKPLYTLVSLEQFKSVLGVDDREDKLAGYCLVTSTYTIEQYCKRRLLRKKYFERIEVTGDLLLPLRESSQGKSIYFLDTGIFREKIPAVRQGPLATT